MLLPGCFLLLHFLRLFVLDHLIEVFQLRAVKLADLLEFLLYVDMLELRKILMQVLGDTLAGRPYNSIPLVAIKIFGERQFVHDEIILHQ